jgi:pantoate--beta-alanine ligase
MSTRPEIVRTVAELRAATMGWRRAGEASVVVPTMGALHAGHISLIDVGRRRARRVAATIFVNPTQFAPSEDFAHYPRDESGDLEKLAAAGTDLVFMPEVEEMYPQGFATRVEVGGVSQGLCGASRPHFFGGVATVVCKLLLQAQCDFAVFGEKDYQQLLVIKRMVRDLDIATEIIGAPIIREPDGLAMSSRNSYLSAQDREMAPHLNATLVAIARELREGVAANRALAQGRSLLEHAGFEVDYVELCDADTLEPLDRVDAGAARLLAGAWLSGTRLIDNIAV